MENLYIPAEEILVSIIETGKTPPNYDQEQSEQTTIKRMIKNIQVLTQKWFAQLKQGTLTAGDSYYTKYMIFNDLMVLSAILEEKLENSIIDSAIQKGIEKGAVRAAGAAGTILGALGFIGGIGLTIKQMVDDKDEQEKVKALLDSIFRGRRFSERYDKKQRLSFLKKTHRWTTSGKVVSKPTDQNKLYPGFKKALKQYRSENKIIENYIMKNTNEGIMDFFKKDKSQTAEEFFEVDRMGSKGAKGLIIKMLDVMTPDTNIEYKGSGREQADAVSYVQDYIKTSFLGKIDGVAGRSDNENADFAKYMDSAAWGENINFDTLVEAAKELYEHAGQFFDETQSGETTESRQATIVTLGVNTIPAILLFHCLKYLGSSLFKMKKRYNKKRMTGPVTENKIIQEYILRNTPQPPKDTSIIEIIADEVNKTLNNLPEIQLASEILNEDELKNLFSPFAKQVVLNVHEKMQEHIKNLVEIEIPPAVVAQLLRGEELDDDIRQELEAAIGAAEVESGEVGT